MMNTLLSIFLSSRDIFMSWGPSKFYEIHDGFRFHVQGFLFSGWIDIICIKHNIVTVILYDEMLEPLKFIKNISTESLVDSLDKIIEKDDTYNKRIVEYLKNR